MTSHSFPKDSWQKAIVKKRKTGVPVLAKLPTSAENEGYFYYIAEQSNVCCQYYSVQISELDCQLEPQCH